MIERVAHKDQVIAKIIAKMCDLLDSHDKVADNEQIFQATCENLNLSAEEMERELRKLGKEHYIQRKSSGWTIALASMAFAAFWWVSH